MNNKKLEGKVAVITGASKGLGKAMALALAEAGARLALISRNLEQLNDTAAAARRVTDAEVFKADVTDEQQVGRLEIDVREKFGKVQILINNAGINLRKPVTEFTLDEWRQVMDVNVASMFLTCRAVVPVMRANGGGKIVNISSGTPFRGVPFLLHYVTSKGAIVAFTRALAKEVGKDNVLVNCVAPGFTMSAGVQAHPEVIEKLRDVSVAARTIQRDQTPEDVVGAVVYLTGPGSDFVTGQTIVIDGGQTFH